MASLEEPRHSDRYVEAFEFACQVHRLQARKGGNGVPNHERVPYVAHLMAVSALVWEGGGDEDQAIAALLHDSVEDHPGVVTIALLEQRFGSRVAMMVAWATDTDQAPKPPWRTRKEDYVKRLKDVDRDAVLVIAADKLHNVRSTVDDLRHEGLKALDRFSTNDPADLLWYYEAVSKRLSDKAKTNVVVRRLRREVRQLDKLLGKLQPEPVKQKGSAKAKAKDNAKHEAKAKAKAKVKALEEEHVSSQPLGEPAAAEPAQAPLTGNAAPERPAAPEPPLPPREGGWRQRLRHRRGS